MIKKIQQKLQYIKYIPLIYSEDLRNAYTEASIVGGRLEGKTVLITGGTGGIGLAIAMRFLTERSNVIISGRDEQKLQITTTFLKERFPNGNIETINLDLCNEKDIHKIVTHLLQREKFIDILVNNAGVLTDAGRQRRFRNVSEKEFNDVWNINFEGTIVLTNRIAYEMNAKKIGGHIINISSACAESRNHQYTPYGISKSALVSYSKKLSNQYNNIIVNVVEPGSVATTMNNLGLKDNITRNCNVLCHLALPEEIASLVAFLAGGFGKYLIDGAVIASACETL